ncbi:alpha/beta hydrolase [Pseudoclavibacter endophyticus]|uniref:Alpha/beta hydrolase n=1 Tax=Pseudoclavibacter endophyticus TaxID=1778590 RepID=A0A6H9WN12_9MICO|nr:alpha/beta hydrolase [Pseudoclavibacter endophyticus]KAB1648148.1 alpha/beta hydrolase [Pseudoclavibacter endophyticus]GGA70127.1 alpha/beta hydrolase [Pseudoclavibacter endophyticus]
MSRTDRPTQSRVSRGRSLAVAAVAMLATVVLSGCTLVTTIADRGSETPNGSNGSADGLDVIDPDLPDDVRSYSEQELDWWDCQGFQCTMASAPMDWDDPSKGDIELAMLKVPASGDPLGTIFVNPGGPGGSGVQLAAAAEYLFGRDVLNNYDIVGWDPRGVGQSTAIDCLDDDELDDYLYPTPDPAEASMSEEELIEIMTERERAFGEGCLEKTGPMLEFVDTISTVHDLDMLRATVGDAQLNYLGFSYGTELGAHFIDTFPERAGRMVLDGAVDPSLDRLESSLAQREGFISATESYINNCLSGPECPFTGTYDDAIEEIRATMDAVDKALPKHTDGRTLTSSVINMAISASMYDESMWPQLSDAFSAYDASGDPSGFFSLVDTYNDRAPDGTYTSNIQEAFPAISCMDAPAETDEAAIAAYNEAMQELDPFARPGLETVGDLTCQEFPFESRATPGPVSGAGAGPVLVIGTTGDPATPYEQAIALADQLESGILVTYEGEGHTVYGGKSTCIDDIVDRYFVDGDVPEGEPVC